MWQDDLAKALNEAPEEDRDRILTCYQTLTGQSRRNLYRVAGKFGFVPERKVRDDKGTLKSGVTEDQIIYIAGLIKKTGRENKGPIMPVEAAMEIAFDAGVLERGQITVGRMQQLLRERQLDKESMKQPTPHTEMRSLHPNYCHLVDVSICIQYYLKDGKMGIMDERDFYKNKPHNFAKVTRKLLRYVLTDHFSGFFYFRYYVADGESRENLWDFLKEAWRQKGDSRLSFYGVPFYMLMDAGCAQTAKAMKNFFSGLQIIIPPGKAHNPRKQGAVETIHNLIERWFETKLRICPATSVEELNEWATDFMIWFHSTRKHTRTRETRLESWQRIVPEQLRLLPSDEILNWIYTEPEVEKQVLSYRMTYRGEVFNLKHLPNLPSRCKVTVKLNPYRWESERALIVIWQNTPYEVNAIPKLSAAEGGFSSNAAIIGQEYKALPETVTQKACKDIDLLAYGTKEPKKKAIPFEGTPVFGTSADKVGNLYALPRRGTPIDVARPDEPVQLPIMDLFMRLRSSGAALTPALNRDLRQAYGERIESAELERVVSQILETGIFSRDEAPADAVTAI